jgi:hypothetical protein
VSTRVAQRQSTPPRFVNEPDAGWKSPHMPEGGWGDMKTAGCSTDIEAEAIDLATLEPHDEETLLASWWRSRPTWNGECRFNRGVGPRKGARPPTYGLVCAAAMASEAEVEAAAEALWLDGSKGQPPYHRDAMRACARAALDAAERVRQAEPRNVLDDYAICWCARRRDCHAYVRDQQGEVAARLRGTAVHPYQHLGARR